MLWLYLLWPYLPWRYLLWRYSREVVQVVDHTGSTMALLTMALLTMAHVR